MTRRVEWNCRWYVVVVVVVIIGIEAASGRVEATVAAAVTKVAVSEAV